MSSLRKRGFTLVDVLLSAIILIIAVFGVIQYRYHSALEMKKAKIYTGGARLAQTLIETWRGLDGDPAFDPAGHFSPDISISAGSGPAKPADHTLLGSYEIQWEGVDYTATMSSRDIGNDVTALNVAVAWPLGNSGNDKEFRLTSYVD